MVDHDRLMASVRRHTGMSFRSCSIGAVQHVGSGLLKRARCLTTTMRAFEQADVERKHGDERIENIRKFVVIADCASNAVTYRVDVCRIHRQPPISTCLDVRARVGPAARVVVAIHPRLSMVRY